MQVNIQEFIEQAGLGEPFYPGKRVLKPCPQPGENKSHCVVYDWHDPDRIRIEIKAGLSGRDLSPRELASYPISFQAPTFIEIDVRSGVIRTLRANDEEETEGETSSGGDGKRPALRKTPSRLSLFSFSSAAEGAVPISGTIANMVVLGMKIAEEAYGRVADKFFTQAAHAKMVATDLVAAAGKLVTRYTPAVYLKPNGMEDKIYDYDREKNEAMFMGMSPG